MMHPPTPPPITTARACTVLTVACCCMRSLTSPPWLVSCLRGPRHQVALTDDVVPVVLGHELLDLTAKRGQPRRLALERLDQAGHRSGVGLVEDAEVRGAQGGEAHEAPVEGEARDGGPQAVAHDGRVPPL